MTCVKVGATDAERRTESLQGTVNDDEIDIQRFRGSLVDEVATALDTCMNGKNVSVDNLPNAVDLVAKFADTIANHPTSGNDRVQGLLTDLTGQVTEAFSQEKYLKKWGRHYIPSLLTGHRFQQCNNFKDPGVQFYGGDLFKEIQNLADDIFLKLPAPVPTARNNYDYGRGNHTTTRKAAAPVNMARYYNNYGGCFDGFGHVTMADGTKKFTYQIRKG